MLLDMLAAGSLTRDLGGYATTGSVPLRAIAEFNVPAGAALRGDAVRIRMRSVLAARHKFWTWSDVVNWVRSINTRLGQIGRASLVAQ